MIFGHNPRPVKNFNNFRQIQNLKIFFIAVPVFSDFLFFQFCQKCISSFRSCILSFYVLRLSTQNKFNSHQPFNVRSNHFFKYPICHFVSIFYQLFLLNVKKHNYETVLKNLLLSATCSAIMKKVVT